jgi:Tfp pilus assembly protein PilE
MGLFKSTDKKKNESGLSLLQGLSILAILGILAAVIINQFLV